MKNHSLSLAMFRLSREQHPVLGWKVYFCETPKHKQKRLAANWLGILWNPTTKETYQYFPACSECRLEMIGHPEALEQIWNRG